MDRLLPDAGGVLDQNDELMWAFGHIDQFYAEEVELQRNLQENKAKHEQIRQSLLAGVPTTR